MTDTNKKVAYGNSKVRGCPCPAVRCGRSPDELFHIVQRYDNRVQHQLEDSGREGIVGEETARRAWMQTLYGELDYDQRNNDSIRPEVVEAARMARELGWSE